MRQGPRPGSRRRLVPIAASLPVLALLAVFAVSVASPPAAADPGRGATVLCYVWANTASPAIGVAYTPSSVYSYNIVGRYQANTVTRTAVGTYTVTCAGVGGGAIAGVGVDDVEERSVSTDRAARDGEGPAAEASGSWSAGGHVQVTAYGAEDADYCKVASWSTGGVNFTATVKCYSHTGAASDNRFDLLFVW